LFKITTVGIVDNSNIDSVKKPYSLGYFAKGETRANDISLKVVAMYETLSNVKLIRRHFENSTVIYILL
jgi:hypothetical protein